MNRRHFLSTTFAAGIAGHAFGSERLYFGDSLFAGNDFVSSEVGRLTRVLVHPPGLEMLKSFPMLRGSHSMLTWELLRAEATQQHAEFVKRLEAAGVEVLLMENLLTEAIRQARESDSWNAWLKATVPLLADHSNEVTASTLIGSDDRFTYRKDDAGVFSPGNSPATTLFFTRDLAVMTPGGVVLCNFKNPLRKFEAALARFAFQYSPPLRKYPVVFDGVKEDVHLQGGDLLVLDAKTLLVGVGNSTTEEAAIRLAQRLKMDVVTVQMPSVQWQLGEWDGLQLIFYHLDCLLNLVDRRKVLAVPYLLEKSFVGKNPLLEMLYGFARLSGLDQTELKAMLVEVRNVGWIKRFKAESGKQDDELGAMKILDYLKDRGYEAVFVGGIPADNEDRLKHLNERVMRECRFMGVNILAIQPGEIVSYSGNPMTEAALTKAGIQVITFPSYELARANGGPHCLTMPLERDSIDGNAN